jgi:hypothetical protein
MKTPDDPNSDSVKVQNPSSFASDDDDAFYLFLQKQ